MRVAFYNQMFGMNGRSFWSSVIGHYLVHFNKGNNGVWKRIKLKRTEDIIKRSKADIVGICEVLEGEEKELSQRLRKIGYRYIYFGEGHTTTFRNLHVKVALASKIKCNKEYLKQEPVENKLGGGGGLVDCYFPGLKLNVLAVHLGTRKRLRKKQLNFLKKYIKKKEKFALIGDFNSHYDNFSEYFRDLRLVSNRIKTCCLTPLVRWFHFEDDDHILVRKMNAKKVGFLEGASDHCLIYADLK